MKSHIVKNLVAVLVLGALGAPLSAYAASQENVTITATVIEKYSIALSKKEVVITDNNEPDNVTITTTSNKPATHGSNALITITSADIAGGKVNLTHETDNNKKMPVTLKIENGNLISDDKGFTYKMPAKPDTNQSTATLQISAESLPHGALMGTYTGTITIAVSPS